MKDFLKAFIPVTIGALLYAYLAEKGDISPGTWPILILLIVTISLVVYLVIRLFRRKRITKSNDPSLKTDNRHS